MQLDLFSEVNKCYSRFRTYLNEFEIQDNVGSKIGCNQPAAIYVVGMIRRCQYNEKGLFSVSVKLVLK